MKRCSSMFISKTKQHSHHQQIVNRTKLNPGLERVCYENKQGTIADEVRRKVDQVKKNPRLMPRLFPDSSSSRNRESEIQPLIPYESQSVQEVLEQIGEFRYEDKAS